MIRYNWNTIYRLSKGSSRKIIDIIYFLAYKPKIYTKYDKFHFLRHTDWSGHSFLKQPELLLKGRKYHRDVHIAEYVGLASLRNYAEYSTLDTLTLDLLAYSGKKDLLKDNSLLSLEDGKIHFLYEEATNGDIIPWH